jgi:phosphoribosylformimino-5-aminoimidazole carboxamide ribotide isomerase
MNLIPAIDLREGRVVRLRQGDFAQTRVFAHEAVPLALRYRECGAEWLHVVDLDGARVGSPQQVDTLTRLAATSLHVQAGGGVRSRADVERLLEVGVARVVVGSLAVREPEQFCDWLRMFGADALCLAMDLRRSADGRWQPAIDAWQSASETDFGALLDCFAAAGLQHVLCTDVALDGMASGPNLALYHELVRRWPRLAWIASGGVRDRADLDALRATGVAACVVGSALLDGTLALEELATCSHAA